jgi:hypothetical protein
MKREISFHEAHTRMVGNKPVIVVETRHPQSGCIEFRYFVDLTMDLKEIPALKGDEP